MCNGSGLGCESGEGEWYGKVAGVYQRGKEKHRDRRAEVVERGRGTGGGGDRAKRDECGRNDRGVRHRNDGGGERCGENSGGGVGRGRLAAAYAGCVDEGPSGCTTGGGVFSL